MNPFVAVDLSGILSLLGRILLAAGVIFAGAWPFATRFWRRRRPPFLESPMRFRVGRPGSGKTLVSVKDAILAMRDGKAVYSNSPIIDPVSGRRSGLVGGWAHLMYMSADREDGGLGLRNFFVLVDEGNVWACSRMSKDIPLWLLHWWAHRRHFGLELHITAQHENRVDVVLRETVDKIDVCERYRLLPKYVPLFKVTDCYPEELEGMRAGRSTLWAPPRFVPWWVFAGYSTVHNVGIIDLKADQAPTMQGESIVHPNYLPGVPWDGSRIPRAVRLGFTGPRAWELWTAFLDDHPELSPAPIENDAFESWVRSEEGTSAIYALAG